jgi:hypothetical protein
MGRILDLAKAVAEQAGIFQNKPGGQAARIGSLFKARAAGLSIRAIGPMPPNRPEYEDFCDFR